MASRRKVRYLAEEQQDLMQFEDRHKTRPRPKRKSVDLVAGIVIRGRGHHFDVQTDPDGDNRVRVCEIRGRLLAEQIAERSKDTLVAVGDHVWVRPNGAEKGLIERIEERASVLSRQRPGVNVLAEDVILAIQIKHWLSLLLPIRNHIRVCWIAFWSLPNSTNCQR